MSSNGFFAHQRNTHRSANANAGTTLKRRGFIGGFQEERNRYAPPQKRARSQTQTPGRIPLYHGSNVSRVSNYGDVIGFNSSNSTPFALRNNDSSQSNTDYQKSFGYGNPNPQLIPFPLPYRKLNDDVSFDSLPEWVPNESLNRSNLSNFPITSASFVPNITGDRFNDHAPAFTNSPNSIPMNHSNMISIVSQAMSQPPIVSKDLSDLLNVLENKKQNSNSDESPLGLDFDPVKLKVRHESVIKSLYSDMPRQCSSCGVRFKCQEDHSNHMDWHVRKNRMTKDANKTTMRSSQKPKESREWFASTSLWLSAATGGTTEAAKATFNATREKEEEEQEQVVPADENQKTCALCVEPFDEFFSHEADEWMYKDAVYLNMNENTKLGPIVHVKCMPETRPGKDSSKLMVTVPSVANALVC